MSNSRSQQGSEKPIKTHNALGRGLGRPFPKGRTANPAGRPKGIEQLARAHTAEAIQALVAALKRPKEAVPAAVALLNRGWGLPKVTVEADAVSAIGMHLLAAKMVSEELIGALERREQRTIDGQAAPTNGQSVDFLTAPIPTE